MTPPFAPLPPAIPELWAGMGGFIVYHPVYTTNEDKSQEGDTKITYSSALGFPERQLEKALESQGRGS
jgi:hypothetical protein